MLPNSRMLYILLKSVKHHSKKALVPWCPLTLFSHIKTSQSNAGDQNKCWRSSISVLKIGRDAYQPIKIYGIEPGTRWNMLRVWDQWNQVILQRRPGATELPWASQHRRLRSLCGAHDRPSRTADEVGGVAEGNGPQPWIIAIDPSAKISMDMYGLWDYNGLLQLWVEMDPRD